MNLAGDDARTAQFVTNVALVTSDGPLGPNVMAAEWTHHISYAPSLIAICIETADATAANIEASREFGISLAGESQRVYCSIAGGHSGRTVDKIAALRALGAVFVRAQRIKALMVEGAAMHAECVVRDILPIGDHLTIVGEVVEIAADAGIRPLLYHGGRYWVLGDPLVKPSEAERNRISDIVSRSRKAAAG